MSSLFQNTAVGWKTLEVCYGSYNTVLGGQAGKLVADGQYNLLLGRAAGDNITSGDGNVIIGSINADSATGDKQLILADGQDGSVKWIAGDSSGNVIHAGTTHSAGGQLTTTGKALVMGL